MAINGLNSQYDLFHNFNSQNALSKLPTVGQDETKVSEERLSLGKLNSNEPKVKEEPLREEAVQEEPLGLRPAVAKLEDISLEFNPNAEFDFAGRDSSIADLDVEKAISDMKKDSILEQYQYFVGDQKTSLVNDEDGIVFQKFPQDMF